MIHVAHKKSKAPKERRVCIAKGDRFWGGPRAKLFAPSNIKDVPGWQDAYRRDLDSRFPDADSLRSYLQEIENATPDPILYCFEEDPKDCHRSVLAIYIKERLGIEIVEWTEGA